MAQPSRGKRGRTQEFLISGHLEQASKPGENEEIVEKQDLESNFKFNRFLKFLGFHVVYTFTGPLASIIVIPLEGYHMAENMGFIGLNPLTIIQAIFLLICWLPLYFYYYSVGISSLYFMEYCLFYVALLTRWIIVSVRHACMSE